jgi:hypothetical protein
MRLTNILVLLPVLAVVSIAQETNFPVGPQYLITNGSTIELRPIATPSLSLGEAHPFAANVSATEALAETVPSTVPSAPSNAFLSDVYWGDHKESQIVGRRLDTPSMTVSETAGYMNSVVAELAGAPTPLPEETSPTPAVPVVIELTGGSIPSNLPASMFDTGVTGMTNAETLAVRSYGVPLGDVAAYWKSHKRAAPHVFSNADVRPR